MLILRLQTPNDTEFAYTSLLGTAPSSDWQYGSWAAAEKLVGGQPVVLLIPTDDVLLTEAVVATQNSRQLKQALPYALEESLVGELEDQHFVWQARTGSDVLDVAVINRTRLKEWFNVLKLHKMRAKAILPDVFALPWADNIPTIWQRAGQIWVRTGVYSGFSCAAASAPFLLDTLFDEEDEVHSVRLYADTELDWLAGLQVTAGSHPDKLWKNSLQESMDLNLLSGYQDESMSTFTRGWKRWRVAAVLSLLTLGVAAGIEGMQAYQLSRQLQAAEAANLAVFNEVFPNISGVSARELRSRVKSEMILLDRAATGDAGTKLSPLPFLSTIGKSFQQQSGLKVTEMRIRSGKLTVVFESPDLQVVELLSQDLGKQLGYPVEIKRTQANNIVRAEFTLEMTS